LSATDHQNRPPVKANAKENFSCQNKDWGTPQALPEKLQEEFDVNVVTRFFNTDESNELSGIIKFKVQVTYNTTRKNKSGKKAPDGIEIRFGTTRPTEELRKKLKEHGFQFSDKQIIWYALDTPKARELADYLENNEVEVDDTQYEKRHFWTPVRSINFYNKLTNYTEFMVAGTPIKFYRNKKQLENSTNVQAVIYSDQLKFKKFYNKIVGEEGEETEDDTDEEEAEEEPTKNEPNKNKPDAGLAEKFEALAQGMQKQIDAKLNSATSRQRPTAKRLRVASGMRQDGYYLQNIQKVLYALSQAYQKGAIHDFPYLKNIRSKSQIELLNKYADTYGRKHEDHYLDSVLKNHSGELEQLDIISVFYWSLAFNQKEELIQRFLNTPSQTNQEQQRQIEELEIKIKSKKIEGFFPTPKKLIDELISIAELKQGESILEPSAGKGDILDRIKEQFNDTVKLSACELNTDLRELLKLKGYELVGTDFLQVDQSFDKIIMNPPFEKGQDIDHVLHALSLLKKGGRLVAIMGEGVFFRNFKKEKEFRDKLFHLNAFISDKIQGAFKDAFNQTGIAVRIVAINQDGTLPEPQEAEDVDEPEENENTNNEEQETEQLELETLAEMELLKMELELKQKKQTINGLGKIDGNTNYPAVWDIH
jgi:phospholipid N-methyltransferase